jgi:hypothetical protein
MKRFSALLSVGSRILFFRHPVAAILGPSMGQYGGDQGYCASQKHTAYGANQSKPCTCT